MANNILCFGEVLWDIFPKDETTAPDSYANEKPGGAPMNVALNLKKLGSDVSLLSSYANDNRGKRLHAYLQENGLSTALIQTSNYPTGTVNIVFNEQHEHSFEIVAPAAWDYIDLPIQPIAPDVLLFGSLACRNEVSYKSLQLLLKKPCTKVFDVNFRKPFVDQQKIEFLLTAADWVKMNDEELQEIATWYSFQDQGLKELAVRVAAKFKLDTLCVTEGAKGAFVVNQDTIIEQGAPHVKVGDTVGAGDAFFAGLLHTVFTENLPLKQALAFAVKLGAFVASKHGANPNYTIDDILELE